MSQQNQIFIGNLAFSIDESDLEGAFNQYGSILEIKIPVNRETKKKRGFGFITFESEESVQNALEMNGKALGGRTMRVNIAQGKKPAPRHKQNEFNQEQDEFNRA